MQPSRSIGSAGSPAASRNQRFKVPGREVDVAPRSVPWDGERPPVRVADRQDRPTLRLLRQKIDRVAMVANEVPQRSAKCDREPVGEILGGVDGDAERLADLAPHPVRPDDVARADSPAPLAGSGELEQVSTLAVAPEGDQLDPALQARALKRA